MEIIIHRFKGIKTDKVDNYIIIGCESDDLYENDKLFNFWSKKILNEEIKMRDFKVRGWFLMTLVKRNNIQLKIRAYVCSLKQKHNQECDVDLFVLFNYFLLQKLSIWVCDFRWLLYYQSFANLSQTRQQILYLPSSSQYTFYFHYPFAFG